MAEPLGRMIPWRATRGRLACITGRSLWFMKGASCGYRFGKSTGRPNVTRDTVAPVVPGVVVPPTKNPAEIVSELDRYIIGQGEAKRCLAIAIRERWARSQVPDLTMRREITPHNILLVGPSGCGKTELSRRLAAFVEAPLVKVVATRYTEVGFVGDDTQSMISDLAEQAFQDELTRRKNAVEVAAKGATFKLIASLLIEDERFSELGIDSLASKVASKQLDTESVLLEEKYLANSRDYSLNEMFTSVGKGGSPKHGSPPLGMAITIPPGELSNIMSAMFANAPPSKKTPSRRERVVVSDAVPLLTEYFSNSLINEDEVVEAAKESAESRGIIFIDEFDKLVDPREGSEFKSKRRGVQKELLTLMEGTVGSTRLGRIHSDHILFIASGSFTTTKPSDIMPELQGRLPIRCQLNSLLAQDYYRILTDTKYNILDQQRALLQAERVKLTFSDEAAWEMAQVTAQLNQDIANVGARRLKTVLAKLLEDIKFTAHTTPDAEVTVTAALVREKLSALKQSSDLAKFVL